MIRMADEEVEDERQREVDRRAPSSRTVWIQRVREVHERRADCLGVEEHGADELVERLGSQSSDEEDDDAGDAALLLPELQGVEGVGERGPGPRAEP